MHWSHCQLGQEAAAAAAASSITCTTSGHSNWSRSVFRETLAPGPFGIEKKQFYANSACKNMVIFVHFL